MLLEALISSKTKRDILKRFLSNPEEKYYVRQIATLLDSSVGTIHRELTKFEKSRILNSEKVGNLKFFFMNKHNPLFKELKQIIFKTEGLKGRMESELKKIKGIKNAFIYGSFAKGEEGENSDMDLFLVGDIDEDDLVVKISGLEREFDREINYTIHTPKELMKEKKNNSFIKDVLNGPKIFLVGDTGDL
ncbi:MAG: nucleotidyltransferase domain-containing protein [Candidatus Omnitrophota bacterium]